MNDLLVKAFPRHLRGGVHRADGGVARRDRGGRPQVGRDGPRVLPAVRDGPQASRHRRWRTSRRASPPTRPARSAARGSSSRSGAASAGSSRASATPTASTRGTSGTARRRSPSRRASTCDKCGKPMVYKQSRFGRFIGCSGYPECKNIKTITHRHPVPPGGLRRGADRATARSGAGPTSAARTSRTCRFVVWQRPVATPCPKCGMPFLTQRGGRGKRWVACAREGCDYRRDAESA